MSYSFLFLKDGFPKLTVHWLTGCSPAGGRLSLLLALVVFMRNTLTFQLAFPIDKVLSLFGCFGDLTFILVLVSRIKAFLGLHFFSVSLFSNLLCEFRFPNKFGTHSAMISPSAFEPSCFLLSVTVKRP